MAATFTVTVDRTESMAFTGSGERMELQYQSGFNVEVGGTEAEIRDVSALEVLTAPGVPIVNRSIYTTIAGTIIPYVVCRNKKATRHPTKLSRWHIETTWKSINNSNDETDNAPVAKPAATTDITPQVYRETVETEEVLYTDKAEAVIRTPNLQEFLEQVTERVPILQITILQYETAISDAELTRRRFKCNEETYRGFARYHWLIADLQTQDVTVSLSGGDTAAVLNTYKLWHNPREFGWKYDLPLIDNVYKSGSDTFAFMDDGVGTKPYGYILSDGTKKSDQSAPNFVQFEPQDTTDFNTFLRV